MAARGVVVAPAEPLAVTPISTGAKVLIVLAALALLNGLAETSNATLVVAILSVGAILAILARINQAAQYHKELMAAFRGDSA